MGDFDCDTEIAGTGGRFRAALCRDWEIWGPNGGYLAAIALRAVGATTRFRRPASFSCHYLSVAQFGEVEIDVTSLRAAKRAESLRVTVSQGERRILEGIAWVVAEGQGLEHDVAEIPDVPLPHELKTADELRPRGEKAHKFWNNFERRPIAWVPASEWTPGVPRNLCWYRYVPTATFNDPFLDAGRALLLIDTLLWSAVWKRHGAQETYIAPSLDVVAHFHRPANDEQWLLGDAYAPVALDGLIGGECRTWTPDGRLVASGRGQLLCRRISPEP